MKASIVSRIDARVDNELRHHIPGQRALVAVSGGADSVALLTAAVRAGADVVAAHCNFHLRGDESNRDQMFVERLCSELGVELRVIHFDVEAHRAEHGGSMEMACRELRYHWFETLMAEYGCTRVLTAHHANDNVETMLLNMVRGCGLEGAKGMVTDTGKVLRPLLKVFRNEIEEYLQSLQIPWIVDSTNLESEPDRNFLRLEVLPLLESRFPGATERLARTQSHLNEAFKIYDNWRADLRLNHLDWKRVKASAAPATLIHEWATRYGFNSTQINEMYKGYATAGQGKTRMWESPGGEYVVLMEKKGYRCVSARMPEIEITQERIILNGEWRRKIATNTNYYIAYFPKPVEEYELRKIRPGDRIMIGSRKSKKVSDVMKEGSVPLPWRQKWPVLAEEGNVVWIPGLRRSLSSLLTADTKICYKFTASMPEPEESAEDSPNQL